MAKIKLYTSTKKSFKILGFSTLFVIIGIWIVSREDNSGMDYFMGWATIIFFGLGVFIGVKQFFDKKIQLEIDENGVWDKTLHTGKIDWKYIKGAYPISIAYSRFISLILDQDYESEISQYGWATRLSNNIGAQKVNLNLAHVKADDGKIAEVITKCAELDLNARTEYSKIVAQHGL